MGEANTKAESQVGINIQHNCGFNKIKCNFLGNI